MIVRLLPVLLLSGCAVSWSPDLIRDEQPDETYLYTISISATYPKNFLMNAQEGNAFVLLPPQQKQNMYNYYIERLEKRNEIKCLLTSKCSH